MATFEWIIPLLLGAALLATLTRRVGAPYPTFLATGGVGLAFVPASPNWTLDPQLALTLFVAPVLLDAATTPRCAICAATGSCCAPSRSCSARS